MLNSPASRRLLHIACCMGFLLFSCIAAQASSTIYDGVIEKVNGESFAVRIGQSPYSSIPIHSRVMTHKDGTFKLNHCNLKQFSSYFIDDVPVTREEIKKHLKPGVRMVTMENRAVWYFLQIITHNADTKVGYIYEIDGNEITLERPQIEPKSLGIYGGKDGVKGEDGKVHLTYAKYPHRKTKVTIADDAAVKMNGKTMPWKRAGLKPDPANDHADPVENKNGSLTEPTRSKARAVLAKRNSILIQPAIEKTKIVLLPPNYGEWKTLVNEKETKRDNYELKYQFLGIVTSPMSKKKVNIYPPHWGEKIRESNGFGVYKLAGNYTGDSPEIWAPVYRKGESPIVDGYYVSSMPAWHGKGMTKPGRIMVCFQRRTRITPDRFSFSSDMPSAWGEITKIEGNTITLKAPDIKGVTISGEQTITLPEDAEAFKFGESIDKTAALKVGNLIRIYDPRPQTILVNAGE